MQLNNFIVPKADLVKLQITGQNPELDDYEDLLHAHKNLNSKFLYRQKGLDSCFFLSKKEFCKM